MKKALFVLILAVVAFGQSAGNWNGWGDTAVVTNFHSDTIIHTKKFPLSSMENSRIDVFANDTSDAGFLGDSVAFRWGYQVGHPSWTTTNSNSVVMVWSSPVCLDTFDMQDSSDFTIDTLYDVGDGTYSATRNVIDTTRVTSWALQSRNFSPEWDVSIRFWAQGIGGNRIAANKIRLVFQSVRRLAQKSFF